MANKFLVFLMSAHYGDDTKSLLHGNSGLIENFIPIAINIQSPSEFSKLIRHHHIFGNRKYWWDCRLNNVFWIIRCVYLWKKRQKLEIQTWIFFTATKWILFLCLFRKTNLNCRNSYKKYLYYLKSKSIMNLNNNYLLTHTLISVIYRSLSYYVDLYECLTAVQYRFGRTSHTYFR